MKFMILAYVANIYVKAVIVIRFYFKLLKTLQFKIYVKGSDNITTYGILIKLQRMKLTDQIYIIV